MAFLGLDVGTTRCKACIFDEKGKALASAVREYGYSSPRPGWAEQDPEEVWSLVQEVLSEVARTSPSAPVSLSVSAQGEAVCFIGPGGQIVRSTVLGMDMRSVEESERLKEQFGEKALLDMAGVPAHPITTLSKLLWIRNHEPRIFEKTRRFFCYEDFIFWKLGGEPAIDYSLAAKTMLFDRRTKAWSQEMLDYLGIGPERLAPCVPSGQRCGTVSADVADKLGLPRNLPLVAGGHDQCCAGLGAGSVQPDTACDNAGTAEVLGIPVERGEVVLRITPLAFSCYDHVISGRYLLATLNQTAGLFLRWFRDVLGTYALEEAAREGKDSYHVLLRDLSPEPAHILVMPHLTGSGTPWIDARSRAAVVGMTLNTTRAELVRAILEGVVFEQKVNLDLFEEQGITLSEIRAVGGCARSRDWLQIRADIFGKPVKTLHYDDASVMGAGILAAIGGGAYSDCTEASREMVWVKETYEPDPERVCFYRERFEIYRDLYPALKNINHRIR